MSEIIEKGEVTTIGHLDKSEGKMVIERVQDVEPILKQNHYERMNGDGYSASREVKKVASIPNIVVEQWLKEGVNVFNKNHWLKVKQKLNDPAYAYLRTSFGMI